MKTEYETKISSADKEAEAILDDARRKAVISKNTILSEAKEEASALLHRATEEANQERLKVKDEMKSEVVTVASRMAEKFIGENISPEKDKEFIDEVLTAIEDDTWQNP